MVCRNFSFIFVATLLIFLFANISVAAKPNFVCSDECSECHKEIYKTWKKSIHAKVFDLLKPGVRSKKKIEAGLKSKPDYREDKSCMNCHVTGYGRDGYSFETKEKKWEGIGCEECHGAAEKWLSLHDKKNLKRRDRKLKQAGMVLPFKGKTVCLKCHGSPNSPYKYRAETTHFGRNWKDIKWAETYHVLPEPKRAK